MRRCPRRRVWRGRRRAGTRPRGPLHRLGHAVPPEGRYSLHVAFTERDGAETWTREFGPHNFTSRLSARNGRLVERFGPLQFSFDLPSDDKGLAMEMRGWSCLGISLPMALAPQSRAREWQEDGRFRFDVPIALPLVGPIVHYAGWLTPDT